jgi:hypothetical protein
MGRTFAERGDSGPQSDSILSPCLITTTGTDFDRDCGFDASTQSHSLDAGHVHSLEIEISLGIASIRGAVKAAKMTILDILGKSERFLSTVRG